MAWNANGIIRHKNELEAVLNTNKIDIWLVSETHITNQMLATFTNYNLYCSNHHLNNARGGSAIIIKQSIDHYEDDKICETDFQATTVTLKLLGTTTVTLKLLETDMSITALYSPPKNKIKYERYMQLFNKHKGRFVIGGVGILCLFWWWYVVL